MVKNPSFMTGWVRRKRLEKANVCKMIFWPFQQKVNKTSASSRVKLIKTERTSLYTIREKTGKAW